MLSEGKSMVQDGRCGCLGQQEKGNRNRESRSDLFRHYQAGQVADQAGNPSATQCGPQSDCVNRAIYIECLSAECRAKDQCRNQRYVTFTQHPTSAVASLHSYFDPSLQTFPLPRPLAYAYIIADNQILEARVCDA